MNNKKPGAAGLRVAQTRSMRRRIAALLRAAHRVVGLRRKRLALGFLTGSGSRIPGGTAVVAGGVVAMLTSTMALTPLPALANVISTTGTCNSGSGGTVGRIATGGTGNGAGGIGYPTAGGSGTYALAAGCNATVDVSVLGGTAYGGFATVTGQGGIAVGFNSQAGTWSLAAGLEARATSAGSTAVGFGSQALSANAIAIGGAGGNGTTALSVANSTIANAPGSIAIGANASRGAQTGGADSIAIGGQSTVASGATSGIALGRGATVSAAATNGIAQGDGASAQSANDVAIGRSAATASGSSGSNIALGDGAVAGSGTAANAIAIGKGAQATGVSSLSIGTGNKVSGANSGAIGDPTTITGAGSYSLGNNNTINANKAFVVGSNVTVATGLDGSIVLGDGSTIAAPSGTGYATGAAAPAAQMSIGAAGTERRITNLAAGSAATDAVNVSQLGKIASNTANTTGGSYDAAGTYTAPTFSVGGTARTNLAAAVNAQDAIVQNQGGTTASTLGAGATYTASTGAISGFSQPINGVSTTGAVGATSNQTTVGAALGALNTDMVNTANIAVKYDSAGGSTVTLGATGGAGAPVAGVKITNLQAGTLSASSTDAVNGSQLFATNSNVTTLTNNVTNGTIGPVQQTTVANSLVLVEPGKTGGNPGAAQTLGNVAAGVQNSSSLQAVNASQLFTAGRSVATVLGGGATYNPGVQVSVTGFSQPINGIDAVGAVTAPTSQTTVAGALTALNNNVANTANIAVKYDSATSPGQITLGATGGTLPAGQGTVKITNLQAGTLSASSTDAVNGSQLFATNSNVTTLTNNVTTGAIGPVQQTGAANQLALVEPGKTGAAPGAAQTLTNVAAGALSATSTDAVNGGQLFATNTNVTNLAGSVTNLTGNIDKLGSTTASTLGAGATYDPATGKISTFSQPITNITPSGTVGTTVGQTTVAGALTALDANTTNLANNLTSGTIGPVQRTTTANQLTLVAPTGSAGTPGAAQTLSNLAAGAVSGTSTDAINGSQLFGVSQSMATHLGGGSTVNTDGTVSAPAYTIGTTTYSNVGSALTAINTTGIKYFHANSTLSDSTATGTNSVAIGPNAVASNAGDVALGSGSTTAAAVGTASTTINGTTYTFAGAAPSSTVSVGAAGVKRTITNVAAGRLSASSTDAINGSQLYATNQAAGALGTQVTNLGSSTATALGGGASSSATGTVSAPTYNVSGGSYSNVGDALTAVDGTASKGWNLQANGDAATQVKPGNTVQLVDGQNIKVTRNGADVTIATAPNLTADSLTINGGPVISSTGITNLAPGALNATSTDAVNGSQLFATNQNLTGQTTNLNNLGMTTASTLGAGAAYDPATGKVAGFSQSITSINPDGTIGTTTGQTTVAGALTALDANTTNLANNLTSGTIGPVQRTATPNQLALIAPGGSASAPGAAQRLTNLAAGAVAATSTDGVNGSQLFGMSQSVATNLGGGSAVNPDGTVSAPSYTIGTTTYGNVGSALAAINTSGIKYFHANSTLADSQATGTDSVAIGPQAVATNAGDVALGKGSVTAATVGTTGTTIAGTAYSFAGTTPSSTVSVGAVGAERTITNVAAGRLSNTSTDAVNGSQLFAANQAIDALGTQATTNLNNLGTTTASTLGAGATYDPATGKISAFSQPITNITTSGAVGTTVGQTTVAGALTALDANTTNLANNLTSGTIGPVQRTATPNQLTLVAPAGSASTPGAAQTLSNLAAGVAATDAVNVSQLQAVQTLGNAYRNVNSVRTGANSNDGSNSGAVGQDAMAFGVGVRASGTGALAIGGMDNNPSGPASYISANAAGNRSVAIGVGATTGIAALNGIAIGSGSVANAPSAIYIGTGAGQSATGNDNSIGIGASAGNAQSGLTNLSVGVNAGASSSGQRNTYVGSLNTAGKVTGDFNTAIGSQAMFSSVGSTGSSNTAVGMQAGQNINGNTNTVLGAFSGRFVTGSDNVAVGNNAGSGITASGTVSIGRQAMASAAGAIAIGTDSAASLSNSVVLGNASTDRAATTVTGTTIGGQAYTFAGAGSVANGVVSVGAAGKERQIINLAAGEISATSTDAINGSQLFATNTAVINIANGATGTVQRTPAANELALVAPGGSGAAPGAAQTLTNLAPGALSATSTDAVNGSQLFAANATITTLTSNVANLGSTTANTLGGSAAYDSATGAISGFSQPINGISTTGAVATSTPQTTVGEALAALNSNAVNLANIAVKYDAVGGNTITLGATGGAGGPAGGVKIANLMAGTADSDAVNVGQLKAITPHYLSVNDGNQVRGNYDNKGATGIYGIAIVAIGKDAAAQGSHTVAIGMSAGSGSSSPGSIANVAIGADSGRDVSGQVNTAVGYAAGTTVNGTGNVATGTSSGLSVTGDYNAAFGSQSGSIVVGFNNLAMGTNAGFTVSGSLNTASGANSGQNVAGDRNSAMGPFAGRFVTGSDNVALGTNAGSDITADRTISIGRLAMASAADAVAIGTGSIASASGAISIGKGNIVSGIGSAAIGDPNTVSGSGSYAIGNNNTIAQNNSFVLGNTVTTTQANSVVLGNASADRAATTVTGATIGGQTYSFAGAGSAANGVVSVGGVGTERQIVNLAAGELSATSTDAVNGSQLFATNQAVTSIANGATGPVQRTTTADQLALVAPGGSGAAPGAAQTLTNLAPGALNAISTDAVNGSQLFATNTNVTTLTTNVTNLGSTTASTLGGGATYDPATGKVAGFSQSITNINPNGTIGTTIGQTTVAGALTALDGNTTNLANNLTNGAIGPVQRTVTPNQLTLVAPGGTAAAPGAAQTLTNVAPGALNATSTDAVNGSQLFATNAYVTTLTTNANNLGNTTASTLGGGATYDPATGKVAGFSQSITNVNPNGTIGTTIGQTTVAGALTALDVNTTNLANNLTNGAIGPVQRTVTPNQLTLVAPGGTAAAPGAAQTLTNLAPGALNAASTDAVNGSQLFATNSSVTTLTTNTNNLGSTTASTLGGGATYDPATGKVAGFSQPITGIGTTGAVGVAANQTTVGDALAALNANAVNLANIAVKYDAAGGNTITLGATGGGGGPAGGVKITNLTAGTLSATSTDAVNGSQLYATNQTVTNISNGQVGAFGSNQATTKAQPVASGTDALAGGFGASATGAASSVIGNNATDNGVANSTVMGNGASIVGGLTGSNVALGQGSIVASNPVGTSSTAVGGTTYNFAGANPAGTVSVGSVGAERTVTNVAAGRLSAASTDAVNGSQLFATNSAVDQLNTQVTNINNGAAGPVQRTGTANQLVLVAPGGSAAAPGAAQTLTNLAAGALSATSTDAVTGSQLHATNQSLSNIQNGGGIKYFHANSTAADSQAVGVGSVAAGPQSVATGASSVALGNGAAATNAGDVALGSGSTTAAAVGTASGTVNGTVYSYAGANPTSTVSVGSAGSERTVTNVAAGRVTAMSTDAVNGSQLFATNSAVNSLATSLGDGGQNAVRYDRDGSGQKTNTVTLLGGDPNAPVLIKNVATGVADSDAANVGQVKAVSSAATTVANTYTDIQVGAALQTAVSYTNQVAAQTLQQANSYTDMRFGQLSQQIGEVQKEARQAAAIGLAASSLRYDERPGKLSAAVGGGVWKGYAAGSMGLGYTSRDQNVRANVSATTTGDAWGIGAGLSFTLN